MLIVNSRVMSPTRRTPMPRYFHTTLSWSIRSPTFRDPIFGGVSINSGAMTSAIPDSHASHFGIASASLRENLEISSWLRLASSANSCSEEPSGQAW
jgi:hypothetical protein